MAQEKHNYTFSALAALYAVSGLYVPCDKKIMYGIQGATALIMGAIYGNFPTNYKKSFVASLSAECAVVATHLASAHIPFEDYRARLAIGALLACSYIALSANILEQQEPSKGKGVS